jgi:hypothetical protein
MIGDEAAEIKFSKHRSQQAAYGQGRLNLPPISWNFLRRRSDGQGGAPESFWIRFAESSPLFCCLQGQTGLACENPIQFDGIPIALC